MRQGPDPFTGLLPEDVLVAWKTPSEPPPPLLPEEAVYVQRAVPKRRAEFSHGRACARRVLAQLGVQDFALLPGREREPLWPQGIVGSITHTDGLCAAAAARHERYAGIGIDVEPNLPLDPALIEEVCHDDEVRALEGTGALAAGQAARLIFSAKEAVYKSQFYLTRRFVGFHELSLRFFPDAKFAVQLLVDLPGLDSGACFEGRFAQRAGFLLTASWIRR